MARPKKQKFEYVERLGAYRKRVKGADGKYIALYGNTPDELDEKIVIFQCSLQGPAERENPLVNDYIDWWFHLNTGGLADASKADYDRIIRHHIKPYMEGMRMLDVYPNDIKRVISHVKNMSESVHNKTYMLLKRIFTSAYEDGDIPENPCPVMHNGGNEADEKTALNDEQKEVLIDALKGTPAYTFCMIGLFSGLRTEEILGLCWDCVHWAPTPYIEVQRALRFKGNVPVVSRRLKSKAARRLIPIPDQLLGVLREEYDKNSSGHVIRNSDGKPLTKTQFRRLWNYVLRRQAKDRTYFRYVNGVKEAHHVKAKLGEKAKRGGFVYSIDFEVTPHILRHTYISDLLSSGTDLKTVQYLAGHEKAKTTLDIYTHLTYNRPDEMLRKVCKAFPDEGSPA